MHIILLIIGGLLLLGKCAGPPSEETQKELFIIQAKEDVRRYLKDPDSAQFEGVFMSNLAVCGTVNAKNSFGAYSGYTRFITNTQLTIVESSYPKGFDKIWKEVCKR